MAARAVACGGTMTAITFGSVDLAVVSGPKGGTSHQFEIRATPHAVSRLKRHFPRMSDQYGTVKVLRANDEIAHDLRWFLTGFPMEVTPAAAAYLDARADAYLDARKTFHALTQTDYQPTLVVELALKPRDYQLVGIEAARISRGLLLADQMGLGKTLQGIGLIVAEPSARPALFVCETHLVRQIVRMTQAAAPGLKVMAPEKGTPYDITSLSASALKRPFKFPDAFFPDVIVLPYSKLAGWADVLAGVIKMVVFDEVQSLRGGTETQKGAAAKAISDGAEFRLGMSGTPVFNYGDEMFNVVDIIRPDALGSFDEFKREWCHAPDHRGRRKVMDPTALGAHLRLQGIMLRRTRSEVGRELPPLQRIAVPVEFNQAALDAVKGSARELAQVILANAGFSNLEKLRAAQELSNKMRQATGLAKAPAVVEYVRGLVADGWRPVLFGWHRAVYEVWRAMFADETGGRDALRVGWYTGHETAVQKQQAIDDYVAGRLDVLVLSLRSGSGIDGLQHVENARCVFGELDWSPKVHDQDIARVFRDGRAWSTIADFLHAEGGSDPIVLDVCGVKRGQSEPMIDPDGDADVMDTGEGEHIRNLARAILDGTV